MRMSTGSPEANAPGQKERKKPGRVPTSCAECRRLKLRCDRKVPCENCFKRGCGSICPSGSLTTGKGNRLILTGTVELHDKIESMAARIRELEEALAKKSDDPRCLFLGNNSLDAQNSTEKTSDSTSIGSSSPPNESQTDSVIDAFGTLTIGVRGETSFMSSTARSEYLVGRPLRKAPTWAKLVQSSRLPARILNSSMLEHDVAPVDNELRELVMGCRPPLSEAIRLCEIYLDWAKTLWTPLWRHELLEEIVGSVYRADSYESIPGPHALSLLFSIFSLASLFDLGPPAYSMEAYEYYILSRVSLEFSSPCVTTTLQTVFALANNIQWLDYSNLQIDPSWTYALAGQGVKLAYRMGLHLHSARFRLEKNIAQKRNTVFWQIFQMDTMLSFHSGRPPNVSLDWIDAPYPDDEFPFRNGDGESEMSWHSWSWRFSRLLHEVLVVAFGAKIPTYSTILELDRKIRDFPVPSHLQMQCLKDTGAGPQGILQQVLVLTMKESLLLNIHRRYFSQALQDSPGDPLKHRYGPSVMAMYRSAWRLIVSHASAVNRISDIAARLPIIWSQALSGAIVMCMIVTRAPSSNMAASSLHEVDVVYGIFQKAAPTIRIASNLWEHIEKVWRRSHDNAYYPRSECLTRAELDRVGGGSTSLISRTSDDACSPASCPSTAASPAPSTPYSDATGVASPPNVSTSSLDLSSPSIHPRIMQDMQSFDGFQALSTSTGGLDYAPPEQFSQTMVDTQFSQFVEAEASKAQEALNMFYPAQPQSFHSPAQVYSSDGMALDPAWQSLMEQLGF